MRTKLIYIFTSLILVFSCSSKKNVVYMQDLKAAKQVNKFIDPIVGYGDVLKISVITEDNEFSNSVVNNNLTNYNQNRESLIFDGFQVDVNGFIKFPSIGKIYVKDMTITEIEKLISKKLVENQQFQNIDFVTLDIKILNWSFTILGEVENPGKYFFDKPDINVIEAVGMAGDLTIFGERKNIRILRKSDNAMKVFELDLTNSDFLSQNFQVFTNDIIIINPNTTRVKNAGIIGNSGTLISLLSFLLTSIIIINN